jgi:serine protease Do
MNPTGISPIQRCTSAAAIVLVVLAGVSVAHPQTDPLHGLDSALRDLARQVTPCVVEIHSIIYSSGKDEDDDHTGDNTEPEAVTGSGVIMDPRGYIVTNAHVVDNAVSVAVSVGRGARERGERNEIGHDITAPARVIGIFREADLAVLKIDGEAFSAIRMARQDDVKQGEVVAAFGSPAGLHHSISLGIVSSVGRQISHNGHMSYIQTDAAINHGSSGGPLVDIDGNLVGITTLFISEGGGSEGLGFAIPARLVVYAFKEIVHHGKVFWADSGLRVQDLSPGLARALRLRLDFGVLVSDVVPGSAAEAAGLRPGDVLTALDGEPLDDVPQYFEHMYHKKPGNTLRISLNRDGQVISTKFNVTAEMTDSPLENVWQPDYGRVPRLGIICSQLAKSEIEKSHLRSRTGILVQSRSSGGDLKSDLTRGDVIRSVNRSPVSTVDDVQRILEQLKPGTPIVLQIERNGQLLWLLASDREQSIYSQEENLH